MPSWIRNHVESLFGNSSWWVGGNRTGGQIQLWEGNYSSNPTHGTIVVSSRLGGWVGLPAIPECGWVDEREKAGPDI